MFDQFASLTNGLSSYFVTLIPMVDSPSHMGNFGHISLVGCLYKLLDKVHVSRLFSVMDWLISPSQPTFLKGRLLVDMVMAMNELVGLDKKSKKSCLIFKVDFEKAYALKSSVFLDYMLSRFRFNNK